MKFARIYLSLLVGASAALFPSLCLGEEHEAIDFKLDAEPIRPGDGGPIASYADVLDEATPAVVSVYTARIVETSSRYPQGLPEIFRQFGLPTPQVPEQQNGGERRQRVGVGSGVIVSESGYVVTNHHVVHDRSGEAVDEIRVRLGNRQEFEAELVGSDEKTDVAVLKIEPEEPLPAITVADSNLLRVGDVVFAIGNPLEVGLTATQGIVSATGRNSLGILGRGAYEDFIQTDAAINLGNSGGALIDARGRLVGINTAIVSGTGGSIGIGFAIPVNLVRNVMTNLVTVGEVPRGLLGLFPETLSPELAEAFGFESTEGALVNQVQEGSPADRAGIRHGDIITRIDDVKIVTAPQLRLTVSQMLPGTEVEVELIRGGEELTLPVVLGSVDGEIATTVPGGDILEGVELRTVSDQLRGEFGIPRRVDGVMIYQVAPDSPFQGKLDRPMVILEVNGERTLAPEDVESSLRDGLNRFYVWLGGTKRFIILQIDS